jgi:hypothetical protein
MSANSPLGARNGGTPSAPTSAPDPDLLGCDRRSTTGGAVRAKREQPPALGSPSARLGKDDFRTLLGVEPTNSRR